MISRALGLWSHGPDRLTWRLRVRQHADRARNDRLPGGPPLGSALVDLGCHGAELFQLGFFRGLGGFSALVKIGVLKKWPFPRALVYTGCFIFGVRDI